MNNELVASTLSLLSPEADIVTLQFTASLAIAGMLLVLKTCSKHYEDFNYE